MLGAGLGGQQGEDATAGADVQDDLAPEEVFVVLEEGDEAAPLTLVLQEVVERLVVVHRRQVRGLCLELLLEQRL